MKKYSVIMSKTGEVGMERDLTLKRMHRSFSMSVKMVQFLLKDME